MARTEARLSVEIWDDDAFLALSATAQRMFMFLLSQRDLGHTGVLPLRERRWASKAAGMDRYAVVNDLEELEQARFVVVDDDAEELLIRSLIRRDKVYRQPQLMRSAADQLCLVSSPRLRAALAHELQRIALLDDLNENSAPIVAEMLSAIGDIGPHPAQHPAGHPDPDPAGTLPNTPAAGSDQGNKQAALCTPGETRATYVAVVAPSPLTLPPSPEKTTASSSSRATREKRATRIPDDFAVTPELVAWAHDKAPGVDGRRETEKFINYWRAKSGRDATKLDWPATWRNWMLTAAERVGGGARASPASVAAVPATEKCPKHGGQRRGRCSSCRSDRLAGRARAEQPPGPPEESSDEPPGDPRSDA